MLNSTLFPGNACFGCTHEHDDGLKIELRVDEQDQSRVVGTFDPRPQHIGFPGITHGGVVYTALDCLSCWTATVLKKDLRAVWVLRNADVTYHAAAKQGQTLHLSGEIRDDAEGFRAVAVAAEARASDGTLLVEGAFKVVPLEAERFCQVAGLEAIPENLEAFLRNVAARR